MNWKDHPKLFIGFNVFSKSTNSSFVFRGKDMDEGLHKRDGIKLIARKIEDMTDEEVNGIVTLDMPLKIKRKYLEAGVIADVDIDLLSIGVYPFPWDETIIETTGGE